MGYDIKYQEINEYCRVVEKWAEDLKTILEELEECLKKLANEEKIEGDAVNAIQRYINCYHLRVIDGIRVVLDELQYVLKRYKEDYTANIDASEKAVLCEDAFSEYRSEMTVKEQSLDFYQEQIDTIMRSVDEFDLVKPNTEIVKTIIQFLIKKVQNFAEDIAAMEEKHRLDLDNVEALMDSLTTFMNGNCLQPINTNIEATVEKIDNGVEVETLDELIAQEKNAVVLLRIDLSVLKGEPAITNDWLNLYGAPTVDAQGYVVEAHPDGNKYDWAMPEELCKKLSRGELTTNVTGVIENAGKTPVVNMTNNNLYVDAEGRYWVAVGPNVMNPDHKPGEEVTVSEMQYGTKIDIVVLDETTNTKYYIPAVVGDVKNHTYPNGIYQTGVAFPNGEEITDHTDGSTVEFMGWNIEEDSVNITNNYRIVEIIVYEGVINY